MPNENHPVAEIGNEIMRQVGTLDEQSDGLGDLADPADIDKEEVASWITLIGKAIFAIFKT